jgi:hypothetical protein
MRGGRRAWMEVTVFLRVGYLYLSYINIEIINIEMENPNFQILSM